MSDLKEYSRIEADLAATLEEFKGVVKDIQSQKIAESAKMAMQAAAQLHGFAVKPLEQAASAIVEAEKQALEQALKDLPTATEQVCNMAATLQNAVAATKIKATIIGGVALAAFAVGIGGGAYFGWQFVAEREDAKLQKIEDSYKTTNQALNTLARRGVGLTATEDSKGVYIGVPYVRGHGGEVYKNDKFLAIHLPSKP